MCLTFCRSDLLNIIYIHYERNKAVNGQKVRTPECQKVRWSRLRDDLLRLGRLAITSRVLSQAFCGTTQHQFRDFQILFVKRRFGSRGSIADLADHAKLPSLIAKSH